MGPLPYTVKRAGERTLALFGDAVDPRDPKASNADIAAKIVERCDSKTCVLAESTWLGGSWVLFYCDPRDRVVFSDALGTESVHYLANSEPIMCATDPELLARIKDLPVAPDATVYEAEEKKRTKEKRAWWPNDVGLYSGIKRLLPNHYLDMAKCAPVRYFPMQKLQKKSEHEIVVQLVSLIRGILERFYGRYGAKLAIVLTGGMDSRIMLAAAKAFAKGVYYFIYRMPGMDDKHSDISVPSRLAGKLGLRFDVIPAGAPLPETYEVVLRGGGGGISRGTFVRSIFQQLTPELLARVAGA